MNYDRFKTDNFEFVNYTQLTVEEMRVLLDGRNNPEIRKWMYNPEPIAWEDHVNYIKSLKTRKDCVYWAIFYEGKMIGSQCLNPYEIATKIGYSGKFLFPKSQGKGLGYKYTYEFLRYVFSNGIVNAINAETKISNERNIKVNKSLGFVEIGRNQDYVQLILTKDVFLERFVNIG